MTLTMRPICVYCTRYRARKPGTWGLFCEAYPEGKGIPDAILDSKADHREPYEGDHGLHFLAKDAEAATKAAHVIAVVRGEPEP